MMIYILTCYFPAIPIQGVKFTLPMMQEEATLFSQALESSPEIIPEMLGGKLTHLKTSQDILVIADLNGVVHSFETKDVRMSLEILKVEDFTVNVDEEVSNSERSKVISLAEYKAKKQYEEQDEYHDEDDTYEDYEEDDDTDND